MKTCGRGGGRGPPGRISPVRVITLGVSRQKPNPPGSYYHYLYWLLTSPAQTLLTVYLLNHDINAAIVPGYLVLGVPHWSVCGKNKYFLLILKIFSDILNLCWQTYLAIHSFLLCYLVKYLSSKACIWCSYCHSPSHFAPIVLFCIVLRLSYCIKWSQIIFLPQSNFYYCFTINTITHGKTSFAASAGSNYPLRSQTWPLLDIKQAMLVTKISPLMTKNNL